MISIDDHEATPPLRSLKLKRHSGTVVCGGSVAPAPDHEINMCAVPMYLS